MLKNSYAREVIKMYAGGIVINPENTHYLVIKDTESNRKIIDKWGDYFPFEFKNKKLILVYNPYKPIDKPSFDFDEFIIGKAHLNRNSELVEAAIKAELVAKLKFAITKIDTDTTNFIKYLQESITNEAKWPDNTFMRAKDSAILEVATQIVNVIRNSDASKLIINSVIESDDAHWYICNAN